MAQAKGFARLRAMPDKSSRCWSSIIDCPIVRRGAVPCQLASAIAVARRLQTGQVMVNGGRFNPLAPFGGYKTSGNGRELGRAGLDEFLETKAIQLPA